MQISCFPIRQGAQLPFFATQGAACADIKAHLAGLNEITAYSNTNEKVSLPISAVVPEGTLTLTLPPRYRAMVPTGLVFDIPDGYSLRFHPRSGQSLKQFMVLANAEAVIDDDYVEESFILLANLSDAPVTIEHGERICQVEVAVKNTFSFGFTETRPAHKSARVGGMGHTGKL